MSSNRDFIKRHPVLTYYIVTFVISWGAIFVILGPRRILASEPISGALMIFVYLGPLLGPCIAGLLLTGLVGGRSGFRELWSRLGKWRVGGRLYAVALLTAPLVTLAVQLGLSLISPAYIPSIFAAQDKASLLISGIMAGVMVGIFEELGWTGFAIPRLRGRFTVLATGLIVGLLWGFWHFPLFSGSAGVFGTLPWAFTLAILLFSWLPPFRVLMVWVYEETGSLLAVMLMHASLVFSTLVFQPAATGSQVMTYDLVYGAVLWIVAAAVAVFKPEQLGIRSQTRRQEA